MAYTSFTTPGSYDQVQSDITAQDRRRKLIEAMQAKNLKGRDSSRMVGDRVVPYGIGEGLTQLASAMLSRSQLKDVEEEEKKLQSEKTQMTSDAMQDVISTIQGREAADEVRGEFDEELGGYDYTPRQAAIEADPMGGAIQAMTRPELQGTGMDKVALAMLNKKGGSSRSPYFSVTDMTIDGVTRPMIVDHRTGKVTDPREGLTSPKYSPTVKKALAEAGASGAALGTSQAEAEIDLPASEATTEFTLESIDKLISHPGMKDAVGVWDNPLALGGLVPGTDAAGFMALYNQIEGKTFKEIYAELKGGGQITEIEGTKGQAAINRMSTATSEKEFIAASEDFKTEVLQLHELQKKKAGVKPEEANIMRFDAQGNLIE